MKSWCSTHSSCCHPHSSISLHDTAATIAAYEQCDYLSHLNFKLVGEINDVQTEKYFYRNKLNHEFRTHTSELEQAYRIISQKNSAILGLQQIVEKLKKQFRVLQDDYLLLKSNATADKQFFQQQLQNMDNKCKQKIKSIEGQLASQYELKLNRRVDEVTRQCEDRIKMYNHQIKQLTENATQLAHELKLMQDQHRDVLLKNDLLIQESINRELRKRDYEAQNNYLRDVSQYQAVLKEKRELKEEMDNLEGKNKILNRKNNQLEALLQVEKTKYFDLLEAFEAQKKEKKKLQLSNYNLSSKHASTAQADTNTEQAFVPIVMPVDLDLISQITALKQFVVQKIVQGFLNFFNKTAVTDPKKKSLSLTTFKNSFEALKKTNPQNQTLLYIQSNLDRIIKIYCPALNYTREYLTIKDEFIKRTLIQSESIENPVQKLYRILQLFNRIKNPITHSKSEISAGELRMVEIKFLATLRKALMQ